MKNKEEENCLKEKETTEKNTTIITLNPNKRNGEHSETKLDEAQKERVRLGRAIVGKCIMLVPLAPESYLTELELYLGNAIEVFSQNAASELEDED